MVKHLRSTIVQWKKVGDECTSPNDPGCCLNLVLQVSFRELGQCEYTKFCSIMHLNREGLDDWLDNWELGGTLIKQQEVGKPRCQVYPWVLETSVMMFPRVQYKGKTRSANWRHCPYVSGEQETGNAGNTSPRLCPPIRLLHLHFQHRRVPQTPRWQHQPGRWSSRFIQHRWRTATNVVRGPEAELGSN